MKDGKQVDKIRVGRYDMSAMRKLMADLGLKRDESYTWEKKKAEYDLEKAFKNSYIKGSQEEQIRDEL